MNSTSTATTIAPLAHHVEKFYLQPTPFSPNSNLPILLYRDVLPRPYAEESATKFLEKNNWEKRGAWGYSLSHHFHPNTHECYGMIHGASTLAIGRGKHDKQNGGILIPLSAGDVVVLPAGTTHCFLDGNNNNSSNSNGHGNGNGGNSSAESEEASQREKDEVAAAEEDEYKFVGVYPVGSPHWRNEFGREPVDHAAMRQEILNVTRPTSDPVYGLDGPLVKLWAIEGTADVSGGSSASSGPKGKRKKRDPGAIPSAKL